jgi:hypothetical protein
VRFTKEGLERKRQELVDDRATAVACLASPGGAALLRYLEAVWAQRGLGSTEAKTAYRVAFRDAVEELKDLRAEGEHAR